jgi:DNA-binding beta-propeller fold protein YncE
MKLSAFIFLTLLLQACAVAPKVMVYHPDGEAPESLLVWPAVPEAARFEYAGMLLGEANFTTVKGSGDGAATRLLRWIAGLGRGKLVVRQLIRPQSGVVDDAGRILVTDAGRQAVLVFDEMQAKLEVWEDAGEGASFQSPVGIAVRSDGRILVADAELGHVIVLAGDGTPVGSIGKGILQRPTGLSVNPADGEVYVSDTGAHDIKVFGSDGPWLRTIGWHGTAAGAFNGPTHLRFDGDHLYVTDTFNARIQILKANGEPAAVMGERGLYVGNLVRPKGVTTDRDGNVYVIESYYDHLLVFDADGKLLLPIGGTGREIGQFFLPAGIWSDNADRIFVADMFNGRVVIFRYLGR